MSAPNLDGWIPLRLYKSGGGLMVDWCYLGDFRLTAPFFEDSLRVALQHPFRVLFRHQTPVATLVERASTHPGIGPSGFIFHMSRCGSTLLGRMLSASSANVVVAEAPVVNSAIFAERLDPAIGDDAKMALVRGVTHALGRARSGDERRYFVKFDCWHALDLPLLRRAFPDVPWVFVYRDPVEVLQSQARQPAAWTVPGMVPMHCVSLAPAEYAVKRLEYAARVMQSICEAALGHVAEGGLLVNYNELPGALFGRVAGHFGCTWSEDEAALMREAARFDAKTPGALFTPDGARKREEAPEAVRKLADGFLGDVYRLLCSC